MFFYNTVFAVKAVGTALRVPELLRSLRFRNRLAHTFLDQVLDPQ